MSGFFFIGITLGRAICGFVTMKLNDTQLIRAGQVLIAAGIAAMLLPGVHIAAAAGLSLIGLAARLYIRVLYIQLPRISGRITPRRL